MKLHTDLRETVGEIYKKFTYTICIQSNADRTHQAIFKSDYISFQFISTLPVNFLVLSENKLLPSHAKKKITVLLLIS